MVKIELHSFTPPKNYPTAETIRYTSFEEYCTEHPDRDKTMDDIRKYSIKIHGYIETSTGKKAPSFEKTSKLLQAIEKFEQQSRKSTFECKSLAA